MNLKTIQNTAFIAAAILMAAAQIGAQQARSSWRPQINSVDLAITYSAERSKLTTDCGCFWLQGGAADLDVPLYKGLGFAANLIVGRASSIAPGSDLEKVAFMAGPRYTFAVPAFNAHRDKKRGTQLFAEALFGGVHGFDGVFPSNSGTTTGASGFSLQAGGGTNVPVTRALSIRALEVDYLHSNLPNGASNSQNDFRLAFGISYHLGK